MDFSGKLDFLMNLTKTANSMLAKHVSMDASYVSRLRSGARRPAKNADYLRPMASYFARHCTEKFQTDALTAAINTAAGPDGESEKPEELILRWLLQEERDTAKPIVAFLDSLSHFSFRKVPVPEPFEGVSSSSDAAASDEATEIFYGTEGKREAVVRFLTDVLRQQAPRTLLLFSEENFNWLTEKRDFTVRWAALLTETLRRGNRIRIIHSISRNPDEMLAGINEWLPIYMTGMVEPYYCPRTRDGVFQRTLFVAPGVAAILSTSVTGRTSQTANYLIRDSRAVEAAAVEFTDYFRLCRPLLHIFRSFNAELQKTLEEFVGVEACTFIRTDALSGETIPEAAAAEAFRDLPEAERAALLDSHRRRLRRLERNMASCRYHEIIRLPDPGEIRAGKLRLIASDFMLGRDVFYTASTCRAHLEHMLALLRRYDNYYVYIDDEARRDDITIYAKEDIGVLIAKNTLPAVVFAINEGRMTAAFRDYLRGSVGKDFGSAAGKLRTIERLEALVRKL
jgi:hypothetical protein